MMYYFSFADIDTFPNMSNFLNDPDSEERKAKIKRTTLTHDTEIIFAMPLCQLHLNTEHLQGVKPPADTGRILMVVLC